MEVDPGLDDLIDQGDQRHDEHDECVDEVVLLKPHCKAEDLENKEGLQGLSAQQGSAEGRGGKEGKGAQTDAAEAATLCRQGKAKASPL